MSALPGFLTARVLQHKSEEEEGFTRRYHITRLVYYEEFRYVNNAIARETEIKKWRREKKVALIESMNPLWNDLAKGWGQPIGLGKQIPRAIKPRFGMTKVKVCSALKFSFVIPTKSVATRRNLLSRPRLKALGSPLPSPLTSGIIMVWLYPAGLSGTKDNLSC